MFTNILLCPACQSRPGKWTAHTDRVVCEACKESYVISDDGVLHIHTNSDSGFDERWRKHPAPQPTTAEQWTQKTGLGVAALEGKTVLDGGCGIGRYCKFAAEHGAAKVIGVDISPAGLTAAHKNAPTATLLQGDLLHIPVQPSSVDLAFSIGVLHHTPDPRSAFEQLARTVKPGGQLAVWVYTNPVLDEKWRLCVDFLHEVTRACPPEKLYDIVSRYAVPIRDAYCPEWEPVQQIIRPAYHPIDEQCISDMFDWHTPQYRSYHTEPEVRSWFESCGFSVDWVGSFPVSMRGKKQ